MNILTLLSISRPRFWLYIGGTYLVGAALGLTQLDQLFSFQFWTHFVYFLLPANLFVYGVNDLFDSDTDMYNRKKSAQEHRLRQKEVRWLQIWIGTSLILALGLMVWLQSSWWERSLTTTFLVLAAAYSTPPFRFKARPIWDFVSNAFYIIPGIIGYYQMSQTLPAWYLIFGLICWTGAMHLFSAIPDMVADSQAKLKTTAVVVGRNNALMICALLWLTFAGIFLVTTQWRPWTYALFIYPLIPAYLLNQPNETVQRVYWLFPFLNGLMGGAVYWLTIYYNFLG